VLVEGYFDFAQVLQECTVPVVASCGTALTVQQAQLLRRFVSKVVLCFDPDAAGQGAAVRSCDLLVQEGFDVNVAILPAGNDPDTFIQKQGGRAYALLLQQSKRYLEYLLDRAVAAYDLRDDDRRRAFLQEMLAVAARIPDAATRDQFADRLAHRASITESVVRDEIRKAAVERRTTVGVREMPSLGQLKPAERGLIWALMNQADGAARAMAALEPDDMDGLATATILEKALRLLDDAGDVVPGALLERLSTEEATVVTGIGADPTAPPPPDECARELRRRRIDREQAALQQDIDRVQHAGDGADINALLLKKIETERRVRTLGNTGT